MVYSKNHGVMFHHFHGENHPVTQGSISSEQFKEIIEGLNEHYVVLNADEYLYKHKKELLSSNEVCLTFDDGLLCQNDIAVPVLNELSISAFFFIYSAPFFGLPHSLEIYRYFRTTQYEDIDKFYDAFFERCKSILEPERLKYELKRFSASNFLESYEYYSNHDRQFRYFRENILNTNEFDEIMKTLMSDMNFDEKSIINRLWMSNEDLVNLSNSGHIIGLHSYSHPTNFTNLSRHEQNEEYRRNFDHIYDITNKKSEAMSHPCGRYTSDTLSVLKKMGIRLGFRSNIDMANHSPLEIPRVSHSYLVK